MKSITVTELKSWMDSNEDFQLIDVREPYENDICTLNGVLIPMNNVPAEFGQIDQNKKVVVHCRSGKRSAQAVMLLEQEGFTNLSNLQGGILAWKDAFDPEMEVY